MANADFTPTKGAYTELKPFRFWCQKVLPLVYDDSLSYYELLCKVVDYLNKTMEDVDTLNTDVTNLFTAYDQLQDWVNAYYESADFEAAIDAGLDRMAEDGRLDALMRPLIDSNLPELVYNMLPDTVSTLLPDEVANQIGGTVENQLPAVVSNQIGGAVQTQLPGVVSNQIGGTVANQLPGVVSNQIEPVVEDKIVDPVEDWLDANVSGGIAVDRTLSVLGAGADAAFTGARLETLDNTLGYDHVDDTGFFITTTEPYAFNYEFISDNAEFSDLGSHTYKMLVIPVNTGDKYCINAHKISIANVSENHFAVTYAFCAKYVGDPQTDIPRYLPTTYSANDAENVIATVPEIVIPTGQYYDETTGYLIVITANIEDPVYKVTGSDFATVDYVDDEIDAVNEDLEGKADIDGTYPYLTAGSAQQLESDQIVTDQKPYLFRRTGADATREYDTLVGGSVVANQLANPIASVAPVSGIEFTENAGIWSITGTATGRVQTSHIFNRFNTITGHKYYISLSKSVAPFVLRENNGSFNSTQTSIIANCPEGKNSYFTFDSNIDITGTVVNITDVAICIYDLTQMFGSSIADHAYTLEQAAPGSGIAWLKSYGFFAGYQAYNAGSMVHVSGIEAHVMIGFNQWDEEYLTGYYNSSGVYVSNSGQLCTKNKIRILPNTDYYIGTADTLTQSYTAVCFYDETETFISRAFQGKGVFTTPANAAYMTANFGAAYGGTYKNDLCINLSNPAKNGTYEPYTVNSYTLDDTITLKGVPKLSNGEIYYDGDTYAHDGTVTRFWGIRAYQEGDANSDTMLTDGTNTIYKLQTPTIEEAAPYQSPQICDPDGTEQYITDGIPVGHDTQYPANLKGEIERVLVQVPAAPAAAGTYVLTCTVDSSGNASYEWAASTGRTLGAIRPVDQIQDQIREPAADPNEIREEIREPEANPDDIQETDPETDPDDIQDTAADPEIDPE